MSESQAPTDESAPTSVTVDVSTLTLGELSELEIQSGRSADLLLTAGRATRRLLALWVHERRNSARPRSWHELSNLTMSGASSSMSPSSPAGQSETSSD